MTILFHGTSKENAQQIERRGFQLGNASAKLGPAVYVSEWKETARCYGERVLPLTFSGRICEISETEILLRREKGVPNICQQSGCDALRFYLYDWKRGVGVQQALAICRPEKIKILSSSASPQSSSQSDCGTYSHNKS